MVSRSHSLGCALAVATTAFAAAAQINVTATTATAVASSACETRTSSDTHALPSGTGVAAGFDLRSRSLYGYATAGIAFTRPVGQPLVFRFAQFATADFALGQPFPTFGAADASGTVDVVLTAPVPTLVAIHVRRAQETSGPTAVLSGSLQIGANAPLVVPPAAKGRGPGFDADQLAVVGSSGLVLRFVGAVTATAGDRVNGVPVGVFGGSSAVDWTVELREYPCAMTEYGARCGHAFEGSADDVAFAGKVVLRAGPESQDVPSWGVLLVGSQQVNLPTPFGCALLTDWFVAAPMPLDAAGASVMVFDAPVTPVVLTMQVAAVGTAVAFSNGLRLQCP